MQILESKLSASNNYFSTADRTIIELNVLKNNRLWPLWTTMADGLSTTMQHYVTKGAARSEKTVIVGERRGRKGRKKKTGGDEARRRKVAGGEDPCHTRTTDSPLLLRALIPAIRAASLSPRFY